jgi:hypothetical protein
MPCRRGLPADLDGAHVDRSLRFRGRGCVVDADADRDLGNLTEQLDWVTPAFAAKYGAVNEHHDPCRSCMPVTKLIRGTVCAFEAAISLSPAT